MLFLGLVVPLKAISCAVEHSDMHGFDDEWLDDLETGYRSIQKTKDEFERANNKTRVYLDWRQRYFVLMENASSFLEACMVAVDEDDTIPEDAKNELIGATYRSRRTIERDLEVSELTAEAVDGYLALGNEESDRLLSYLYSAAVADRLLPAHEDLHPRVNATDLSIDWE